MKTFSFTLVLCASLLFFYSCDKQDEPDEEPTYTEAELSLHAAGTKYWLLHQEFFDGKDITSGYKECEIDNVHIFDTYGNYNIDAGVTKCPQNPEENLVRGYYKLDEEKQTFEIGYADTVVVATLVKLSTDELSWETEVEGIKVSKTYKPK